MLKFELVQTDKHSNKRFATTEKSPIFKSHKSYKNPLAFIMKHDKSNELLSSKPNISHITQGFNISD